jgi:hypothetical protein
VKPFYPTTETVIPFKRNSHRYSLVDKLRDYLWLDGIGDAETTEVGGGAVQKVELICTFS